MTNVNKCGIVATETMYTLIKNAGKNAFISKYHPIVLHEDVVPKEGPLLIAANHQATFDSILITLITNRVIHWAAKKDFFDGKDSMFNNSKDPLKCLITAIFVRITGNISIDRNGDNTEANAIIDRYLSNSRCVGLFPEESTRKRKNGEIIGAMKKGVVINALKHNCPIQPVSLVWNSDKTAYNRVVLNYRQPISLDNNVTPAEGMEILKESLIDGINESEEIIKLILK